MTFDTFINSLDIYIEKEKTHTVWVDKPIHKIQLTGFTEKISKSGYNMMLIIFRELETGTTINHYVNYGHPNNAVKGIAAKFMKNLFAVAKVDTYNELINLIFKANLVRDEAKNTINIKKIIELTTALDVEEEDIDCPF